MATAAQQVESALAVIRGLQSSMSYRAAELQGKLPEGAAGAFNSDYETFSSGFTEVLGALASVHECLVGTHATYTSTEESNTSTAGKLSAMLNGPQQRGTIHTTQAGKDPLLPGTAVPKTAAPDTEIPEEAAELSGGSVPSGDSGSDSRERRREAWMADDDEIWSPGEHEMEEAPTRAVRRHLRGQCPQTVILGEPFSVLASVVTKTQPGETASLKLFGVGPRGADVLLVLYAPGLRLLSAQRQTIRVPRDGDSEPVMFELLADSPGPQRASITAWADGTYLGQLDIETTAASRPVWHPGGRETTAEIGTEPVPGGVSLVVRHDRRQNSYRFEFRDEDYPEEVTNHLAYDPGPRVEQLVADLDRLTKGRSGYSAAETRDYLMNAGAALWTEMLPAQLREQFWERQHRISQLTILADSDVVPWELLYPLDPGHDAGFLVEQFPVTRGVFGRRPTRTLQLAPAWFVLPTTAPAQAQDEVTAMLDLFYGPGSKNTRAVVDGLTPLLDLIRTGDFGLLHFACHSDFRPAEGSAIYIDRLRFTPTQLTAAAIGQVLARTGPTVFINSCRSAGASPSYRRLDGWARKFLDAGAAAFIGSLWAVRDSTAREFASEVYRLLLAGHPLARVSWLADF